MTDSTGYHNTGYICNVCLNEWKGASDETRCPFCGADLSRGAGQHDVPGVISFLINKEGVDVLLRPDYVMAFILDLVREHDREKELMRVGVSKGVLQRAHAILAEPRQSRREVMVLDMKQHLMDKAFLSESNAEAIVMLTLQGIGLPALASVIRSGPAAETVSEEKKPSSPPPQPKKESRKPQGAPEKEKKPGRQSGGRFIVTSISTFAYDGSDFTARKVRGPLFLTAETRMIGILLSYHPLASPMEASVDWQIFLQDGTPVSGVIHGSGRLNPGDSDFYQGWGWKEPGRWKAGRYIIRATMNGSEVVTTCFDMVDGKYDNPALTMYGARLFTAGATPPPIKERKYAETFPAGEARKIYFEISMSSVLTSSYTTMKYLIIGPDGEVVANYAEPVRLRNRNDRCWTGFGWDTPGHWRKGRYYYEVTIGDSNNLFRGVFDIV